MVAAAALEEKRLDGLMQSLPIRVVMAELFVAPKYRSACAAIISQRIPDPFKTFPRFFPERLGCVFRTEHKHTRLDVIWYLLFEISLAFLDLVIEVDEHDDVSVPVFAQLLDIFIPKRLEHLGPATCGWHNLYSRILYLRVQHESIGDLAIGVVFGYDIDVRRVSVHGHPMISSRIRALIRSPP